ncbi:MAG: hypothetical protein KI792_00960 [Alphaproteobacteria bacterium]|nr:hypothetical protein [Alphaproteobacteria bacterium SS10]
MAIPVIAYVRFPKPSDWDEEKLFAKFVDTAPLYHDVDGLMRKDYHYDPTTGLCGGLYFWDDEAKARAFHQGMWLERLAANYGAEPEITWLQIPVTADGENAKTIDRR